MADEDLLLSLRAAVERAPEEAPLRLHLAQLLLETGQRPEALQHIARALADDPASAEAQALMVTALAQEAEPALAPDPSPTPAPAEADFDWDKATEQLGDVLPPMFVDSDGAEGRTDAWEVERVAIKLDDVGGLTEVKERLEASFLGPLRNPELRRLYGKTLGGGLLLYGPPGCGKSYLARALAGELEAGLVSISIHEVLDMWIGASERNLHGIFELARRNSPCVLFIDELDALGRKRSQLNSDGMRSTVNQLLAELDGIDSVNEGVFVLGATNHPWDIDIALRRPGRFDRMILVLPPDAAAREAILRSQLEQRPVERIDLASIARQTEGYSGADLVHLCDTAVERVLMEAVRSRETRMIRMDDLEAGLKEVKPSTAAWFESARNVVAFANTDGTYDELRAYLKRKSK
jgi:SpoVK/Ycf46/Vps4 family AAA+-type ATPase